MLIESMTRQASIDLLERTKLGRLACSHDGQPYINPISFALDADCLYCVSTIGQKIAWMRANPLVCVEAAELVSRQDWASVIVLGRYEELPDTAEYAALREHAYDLLQKNPLWWEPAYVKSVGERARVPELTYFRIHIDQISGRRGIPESGHVRKASWREKLFGSWRGH